IVTIGLVWTAHVLLIAGTLASGVLLRSIQPALHLSALPPDALVGSMVRISATALLGLTIQHWVSLRWQSFTTAIGFGMCVMVAAFIAANSAEWGRWFPWSMPLLTVRPGPGGTDIMLYTALAGAAACAALGCWEFTRREIA
ncbi:MAG: hypothetical protein ABI823_20030, partial [Bryobacteraceae bacterium]